MCICRGTAIIILDLGPAERIDRYSIPDLGSKYREVGIAAPILLVL